MAQSIGGGGGQSSSILSLSAVGGSESSMMLGFNFGSVGGEGNDAGTVTVTNGGTIETSGDGAHGILAQSVGGGGGNGGVVFAGSGSFGNPYLAGASMMSPPRVDAGRGATHRSANTAAR